MDIIDYVVGHSDLLMSVLFAAHGVALAIVNLTPTPKDNEVVARVYKVLEVLAGLFTKKAKQ